ncbi:uncharacterized protein LOC135848517 [Planococcus citri]|uniref:uncharacterized protein LOC135848517 n=1 Tax=Planococcus citri TaxID=170843 RepID=UPI0031F9E558
MSTVMSTSSLWSHEEPIAIHLRAVLAEKDLAFDHLENGQIALATQQWEPGLNTTHEVDVMLNECYFQDNTKLFPVITESDIPVAFFFPPGSGKSSVARLFELYASNSKSVVGDNEHSKKKKYAEMDSFFKKCRFASESPELYKKYRSNHAVVNIDFKDVHIAQNDDEWFFASLCSLMELIWNEYAPEEYISSEQERLGDVMDEVVSSLQRLVLYLAQSNEKVFILLDSCDVVFNLLAKVEQNREDKNLSKLFRTFLLFENEIPKAKHVFFGVNPYFAVKTLDCQIDIYSIWMPSKVREGYIQYETNKSLVRECFSYSEESIKKVSTRLELGDVDVILNQCIEVAKCSFNGFELINPYLATAYLTTLKRRTSYSVKSGPGYLWDEAIYFTEKDVDIIGKSLTNDTTALSFPMLVSCTDMDILKSFTQDRTLFYDLLIYGGYFSSETKNESENEHVIWPSNQTTKLVLEYMMENIWKKKYQIGFTKAKSIFTLLRGLKFQEACEEIASSVAHQPSEMSSRESNSFTMDNRQKSAGNRKKPADDESGYKSKLRKRR